MYYHAHHLLDVTVGLVLGWGRFFALVWSGGETN